MMKKRGKSTDKKANVVKFMVSILPEYRDSYTGEIDWEGLVEDTIDEFPGAARMVLHLTERLMVNHKS